MPEQINIELRPQPKWTILPLSDYVKFNHDLSIAKGYVIGNDTERVLPMNPQLCKVNIQYDAEGVETSYELKCVALIEAEVQENYPELISTFTLIDRNEILFADTTIEDYLADNLNTEQVDWTINQIAVNNVDSDLLHIFSEPRTTASDEAIDSLVNEGKTVITIA